MPVLTTSWLQPCEYVYCNVAKLHHAFGLLSVLRHGLLQVKVFHYVGRGQLFPVIECQNHGLPMFSDKPLWFTKFQ